MDGGLTAGLEIVSGEACVLMTADLQDPPEMIHQFLRLWEDGWENIYGVLTKREGTGPIRTMNSKLFYFDFHLWSNRKLKYLEIWLELH